MQKGWVERSSLKLMASDQAAVYDELGVRMYLTTRVTWWRLPDFVPYPNHKMQAALDDMHKAENTEYK